MDILELENTALKLKIHLVSTNLNLDTAEDKISQLNQANGKHKNCSTRLVKEKNKRDLLCSQERMKYK